MQSEWQREWEGTQDQTGVTPTFCLTGENEALSRTLHLCYCLQQMAFKCKFLPGLKEGCGLCTYIPHLNSYNLHNGVGIKMRLHNDSSVLWEEHTTHHTILKHLLPYIQTASISTLLFQAKRHNIRLMNSLTKNDFLSPYPVESPSCFSLYAVMLDGLYCQHLQNIDVVATRLVDSGDDVLIFCTERVSKLWQCSSLFCGVN